MNNNCENTDEDCLNPSHIGTKEYWDSVYSKEIDNFNGHGDVGEIWFGKGVVNRLVQWLDKYAKIKYEDSIIDIGCGNGWTLIQLAKLGYKNLTGVDYSANAIALAADVATAENISHINYQVCDLLDNDCRLGSFKVVLDKGTYDAISLSPDESNVKRSLYKSKIKDLLLDDGYFAISSCNWTVQQLISYFSDYFEYIIDIPSPKVYQFGGNIGSDCTTIVLRKKS